MLFSFAVDFEVRECVDRPTVIQLVVAAKLRVADADEHLAAAITDCDTKKKLKKNPLRKFHRVES